ncbi:ABC transporter ATP-binding protein [Paenibacillus sp. SC116]|uniref:ABC transporter ATP-binding protein n=1 Tax=Paenibacillus sp. SC116 TaxID=2968986 RepID=UPI00215AE158|nr:ABC transporter ATP-binding protein [Paenibacillus sp. SC116]MCR8845011.1 ABC transporter ATP-binding protein [Paenibacillus sp. SC116]
MSHIIALQRVTKSYGGITAIHELSLSLAPNKIYGLLGRNGAGKTTLLHMLAAQLFASSGDVKVFGEDPFENESVLRQICFIKESQKYPETFRVVDVLKVSAALFPNWDVNYANSLIDDFGLPLKRNVHKLSRGMLASLGIIVGLASRAPITIFDEPYLGLDAIARGIFYDRLLGDYEEYPRTIILSTHLIDEASRILEHVILLEQGSVLIDEDVDQLRERAFTVVGAASTVEGFLVGKEVVHREAFGGLLKATLLGNRSGDNCRQQAQELDLEIVPLSLQQLVVYVTSATYERKVVESR